MKKHKPQSPDQASASNREAELFILPPDVLEKLGISLGNVQHSEVVPSTSLVNDTVQSSDHSTSHCLPENEDASSIIETASLMKESVFLSPTFFDTNPNVASDNEELIESVNKNTTISSECGTVSNQCIRSSVTESDLNSAAEQSTPQLLDDSIVIKPNTDLLTEAVIDAEYESVKENQVENHGGDLILTDVPHQNTDNDKISNEKLAAITDDHPDEAYLSDCSNSYSGCSPESVKSEVNKHDITHKNKCKEISETIATDSLQLQNDMDVICPKSNTVFALVNMKSVGKLHRDCSDLVVTDKQPAAIATIKAIDEPVMISDTAQSVLSETDFTTQKGCANDESLNKIKESTGLIQNNVVPAVHFRSSDIVKNVISETNTTQNVPSHTNFTNQKGYDIDVPLNKIQECTDSIQDIVEPVMHAGSSDITQNVTLETNFTKEDVCVIDVSLNNIKESTDPITVPVDSESIANNTGKQDHERLSQQNVDLVLIANSLDSNEPSQESIELISVTGSNCRSFPTGIDDKKAFDNTENNLSKNNRIDITTKNKEKRRSVTENIISTQHNVKGNGKHGKFNENAQDNIKENTQVKGNTQNEVEEDTQDKVEEDTQDKVKEIAAILSQIANEGNKFHKNSNKNMEKEAKGDHVTSKLCIQGVEKPGGKIIQEDEMKCVSVSKTYQRSNIRKTIPKVIEMPDAIISSDVFQLIRNKHEKSDVFKHPNECCICYDFGNFDYYDCEKVYEHIHFWTHTNIEHDPETLFGIYNEDYTVLEQSSDFIEDIHQHEHDGNTTIQNSFCWYEINTNNDENCESTNKSILPTQTCSSNVQKSSTNAVHEKSVAINKAEKPEIKKIIGDVCNETVSEKEREVHKEKDHNSVAFEAERNLVINSGSAPEPSTPVKSTQTLTNISNKSDANLITVKSNDDDKHASKSSNCVSVSEVTPKVSAKSNNVVKSPKSTKKASITEKSVTSTSPQTSLTSKKQSNSMAVDSTESSMSTKSRFSLNIDSDNLSTTSNETDSSKREKTVTAYVSSKTNNEFSRTTRSLSTVKSDSSKSLRKSTENNKIARSKKTKESNTLTQDFPDKGNTLKVGKASDIRNYMKPVRKVSDISSQTDSNSALSVNDTHKVTTGTTKPIKRSSNTAEDTSKTKKKVKLTESAFIFEVSCNDESKKHIAENKAGESTRIKIEKHSKITEQCASSEPAVARNLPTKVEIIDSDDIGTSVVNSILPDNGMDMSIENYTESMNMNINECSIPDDSFAAAIDNSTSSDITMNESPSTEFYMVLAPLPMSEDLLKCGVCEISVEESEWIKHISSEHNYIAWREGESPLDKEDEIGIKKHLQNIANREGGLECSKCGLVRKFAKKYLDHIRSCTGVRKDNISSLEQEDEDVPLKQLKKEPKKTREKPAVSVTCGVCSESVEQAAWIEHIQVAHKYLAWTSDEQPLDLNNDAEVKRHLKYISKNHGGLSCNTCGRNYIKKYLTHIRECDIRVASKKPLNDRKLLEPDRPSVVTCGICKLDVEGKLWIKHIQVAHEYMAWIGGEKPLDPDNPEQVKQHLDVIVHAAGELVCSKCGESRRSAHAYLQHVRACARTGFQAQLVQTAEHSKSEYVCGVCNEKGKLKEWNSHAMLKHYNIAWRVGDIPINLRNPYAVEKYLKAYRKKHDMICHHCKQSRSSCVGFYAHILTCGKTEEEIEAIQNVCEICNNKYLCIYQNQHMAAHRDSDRRREQREILAQKAEEQALNPPALPEPGAKRRAAEKAKQGILKYTLNIVDGVPVCGCGETFKDMEEFHQHGCPQKLAVEDDGSDVSVKMENESEESADEIIDSGVSEEEDDAVYKKKKRVRVGEGSTKIQRVPYKIHNYKAYLSEAYKDFVSRHYATQSLFNEWRDSECTVVPTEETAKYLPQLTESCKVRIGDKPTDDWITYKRFEAKKIKGYSLFTGGATQCMSWIPPNEDDAQLGNYLAVCPHRGPDVPRCAPADLLQHPASLQIWDFRHFDVLPRCALCIAHEYGTVWAMDWCPSGARDAPVPQESKQWTRFRLGLLAVACSNGSAYILAVPCPPPSEDNPEPVMCKLKPVAELRLTMTPERRIYQATSINWSQQKGHSTIIVGYSDGTTALYDLDTESPFLKAKEDGVAIFYPYQDRRPEYSSVTGVGITATANESYPIGGQFSTSITGGTMSGAGARPSARVHQAASGALHAAHWPSVTLAGDLPFMRTGSEMEWWGGGRCVGAGRAWAACMRCARAASAAPPALRAHILHPVYPEIKKLVVAMLVMVGTGARKRRKVNDELSVVVEPLTYEDAAARYGVQLTFVTKTSRSEQILANKMCNENKSSPERFPLSDVVALAYCPSRRFHDRLAVATHTGLIFVLNI